MRALATSLETQLSELRKRRLHEQPGANLFWKRVADQLLLDRQRATTENERLREIFQDQVKALKSAQRTLSKSPDLEKLGVAPARTPELTEIGPSETYSRLFEGVEHAFQGTESVLEQAGIREASENSRRVNMNMRTEDGRSVMVMQVAESRLLPYDVSSVNEGVWQFLANSSCSADSAENEVFQRVRGPASPRLPLRPQIELCSFQTFRARGNDVFGVCQIGCSLGLYTLNGDVAVRRFMENNRLTYVWECLGRCINDPCPSNSFRMQEKGWVVFEPSPSDPHKSIFRSCVQFIPQPMNCDQELGTAAKDVGLMTEVAMSVYERTIGYIYECVVAELENERVSRS
ncbi:hypothetical protein PINS_up019755 [Pythium insidiosum]|nr:hypothetical protein PINS_up019755 [Pythium insidiosum]